MIRNIPCGSGKRETLKLRENCPSLFWGGVGNEDWENISNMMQKQQYNGGSIQNHRVIIYMFLTYLITFVWYGNFYQFLSENYLG